MTHSIRVTAQNGVHTWEVRGFVKGQLVAFYLEASETGINQAIQEKVEELKKLQPAEFSLYLVPA
jgi:hypothetical protein